MPGTDGNASQSETVRIIAEQLFETWKRQQERERKETRRWFAGNIWGFIGALAIVVSAIIAGARTHNLASEGHERSLRNETAIAAMKADNSDRLARIETKIDVIMGSPVQ